MSYGHSLLRVFSGIGLIVMLGASMSACGGSDSWKEQVLLHDGTMIVVERSQGFGGRHELGQSPPITEQEISFILPNTRKRIFFKNDYGEDIGRADFMLLALHVLNGTPYIVAEPNLCMSYNKWGRPNPPYVVFKYAENKWQRIPLEDLPNEFIDINLVVSTKTIARKLSGKSTVSAELVRRFNSDLTQSEYKAILRKPLENKQCPIEFSNGKGAWLSIDWFRNAKDLAACTRVCELHGFKDATCPCGQFFKEN